MSQYLVWFKISFATLISEEKSQLQNKLQFLAPLPMSEFEKELQEINTKYPTSIPLGLQLSVQIVVGLIILGVIIVRLWLYCKHKSQIAGVWQLPTKVPDLL